jgi:hypothetical protein
VNITMISQRGYRSALSACPALGAAFAAAPPAEARLRGVRADVRPCVDAAAAPAQGTGLPAAVSAQGTGLPAAGRIVADVPGMTLVQFVQPHPGDRARRHPV